MVRATWGRYVLVFLATALAGLAVWVLSTPAVAGRLFGEGAYEAAYSFPLFAPFGLPLLALVAAVTGYLLPKGFYLWGVAVVLLHPVADAWLTGWVSSEGAFGPSGIGGRELLGLVVVQAMMLAFFAVACTIAAAVGAGLRLLWWRFRGRPVLEPGIR